MEIATTVSTAFFAMTLVRTIGTSCKQHTTTSQPATSQITPTELHSSRNLLEKTHSFPTRPHPRPRPLQSGRTSKRSRPHNSGYGLVEGVPER